MCITRLLIFFAMKYFHEKSSYSYRIYGTTYSCDHPVYNRATLYICDDLGLCVIQQRYDTNTKQTWWAEIDPWLVDEIYLHPKFNDYFNRYAGKSVDGIYPTVTVRQIMWALRMKPIKREKWETVFDKSPI